MLDSGLNRKSDCSLKNLVLKLLPSARFVKEDRVNENCVYVCGLFYWHCIVLWWSIFQAHSYLLEDVSRIYVFGKISENSVVVERYSPFIGNSESEVRAFISFYASICFCSKRFFQMDFFFTLAKWSVLFISTLIIKCFLFSPDIGNLQNAKGKYVNCFSSHRICWECIVFISVCKTIYLMMQKQNWPLAFGAQIYKLYGSTPPGRGLLG
jgi:hypothetical protein